jgi:hypothetical protein
MTEDYIRQEIQRLDAEIDQSEILISGMEQLKKEGGLSNDNLYRILVAKVSDWKSKRAVLVDILTNQLRKD